MVRASAKNNAWAADVNVLDAGGKVGGVLRHSLIEGVEVHNGHVDRPDAVLGNFLLVLFVAAASEEAAVDLRVEGLDAAVQDLWRASVVCDILHGAADLPELGCGAARGEHVDALLREELAKLLDASLVEDRDQGSLDLDLVLNLARDGVDGRPTHCSLARM